MSVDVTNKMQREREYFQKSLDRQQKSHDSEVNSIRKSHEYTQAKQKESFLNQKNSMEKEFGNRYTQADKAQREALHAQDKAYTKIIDDQKEEFHNERENQLIDFDRKFTNIRNDFERENKILNEDKTKQAEFLKGSYDERMRNTLAANEKAIQDYQDTTKNGDRDLAVQFHKEKANLEKVHDEELRAINNSEMEKRNLMKSQAIADVNQIRKEVNEDRLERNKLQAETFERLNNAAEEKVQKIRTITTDQIHNAQEEQKKEIRDNNRVIARSFVEQERNNSKNLHELEMKNRANTLSRGGVLYELEEKNKLDQQDIIRQKSETLIKERDKVLVDSEKRLDDANDKFVNDLQELKVKQAEDVKDLKAELTSQYRLEKTKDRSEREEVAQTFKETSRLQVQNFDSQVANQKTMAEERVDHLKYHYDANVDKLKESTQQQINILKDESAAEKREMIQRLNEQSSSAKEAQRQLFLNKISAITEGYEKRILNLENQNSALKQQMVDSINHLSLTTQAKIEKQEKYNQTTLKTEIENERNAFKQREAQLRKQMNVQEQKFSSAMDKLRLESLSNIKALAFKYNQELDRQQEKYKDIIDQDKKFADREVARVKLAGDAERDRIIVQYEEQLKQLRAIFEKKEAELNQFNKMNRA